MIGAPRHGNDDGDRRRGQRGRFGRPNGHGLRRRSGRREVVEPAPRPLAELPPRRAAVVVAVEGGDGVRRRAFELGMVPGTRVESLMGRGRGARVVRIGETRLIVGAEVAQYVLVSEHT